MSVPITTMADAKTVANSQTAASASAKANASTLAMRSARYSLLTVELPGQEIITAGVLLEDPATDRVHIRLRRDWQSIDPDEAEVLAYLEDDLLARAAEEGAAKFFAHLEDTLSNTIRVSDRREAIVEDFPRALARLYREHVRSEAQPFVTHLPRYRWRWRRDRFWRIRLSTRCDRRPSLGRSAGWAAPDARDVRGGDRGPFHGTADSGRLAVRVPQRRDRIAAGAAGAGRGIGRGRQ